MKLTKHQIYILRMLYTGVPQYISEDIPYNRAINSLLKRGWIEEVKPRTYKLKFYFKVVTKRRKSLFAIGKYSRHYRKGTIVSALQGTLGLFCFKSYQQAKKFSGMDDLILIVKGIGKEIRPVEISSLYLSKFRLEDNEKLLEHFYRDRDKAYIEFFQYQSGVCFPKIKVLT